MFLFQQCQLQSRLLRKGTSLPPPPFLHVESVLITSFYLSSDSLLHGREMCVSSVSIPLMSRTCAGNGQNIDTFNHLRGTYLDQAPSESGEVFRRIQVNTYLSRIQQSGNSLEVQCLEFKHFHCLGPGLIPGWEIKILQDMSPGPKKKNKTGSTTWVIRRYCHSYKSQNSLRFKVTLKT